MNPSDPITPTAIVQKVNADNYIAVKNIIARQLDQLDRLTAERKIQKEKLSNIFENTSKIVDAQYAVKQAQRELKAHKAEVMATQEAQTISVQIREHNEEIKELQESLSNHLKTYAQITGTNTIEDLEGNEREFKVKASIKPRQLELFNQ